MRSTKPTAQTAPSNVSGGECAGLDRRCDESMIDVLQQPGPQTRAGGNRRLVDGIGSAIKAKALAAIDRSSSSRLAAAFQVLCEIVPDEGEPRLGVERIFPGVEQCRAVARRGP